MQLDPGLFYWETSVHQDQQLCLQHNQSEHQSSPGLYAPFTSWAVVAQEIKPLGCCSEGWGSSYDCWAIKQSP